MTMTLDTPHAPSQEERETFFTEPVTIQPAAIYEPRKTWADDAAEKLAHEILDNATTVVTARDLLKAGILHGYKVGSGVSA